MKTKKAAINQVFVYIMSTIVILFVGYLVVKFTVAFSSDSQTVIEDKFYSGLENDIRRVASRYGSEELYNYKITSQITNLCFVSEKSCTNSLSNLPLEPSEIELLAENSNFLIFDKDGIIAERKINSFKSDSNNGCFCVKPNNGNFKLLVENRKNTVFISEYLD